jgi:group I intron endonuclease
MLFLDNKGLMKIYIYKLIDPVSGAARYVGKTNNPANRIRQHRSNHCYSTKKWVDGLRGLGLSPKMEVLEETDDHGWHEREQYWIELLRSKGEDLFNIATTPIPGKRYGYVMSESTKEKIRNSLKGRRRVMTPEWRAQIAIIAAKRIGVKQSPELVAKRKATLLARYGRIGFYGEHHRKANSEAKKGHTISEETRERMRLGQLRRPPVSTETREKLSKARKAYFAAKRQAA